MDGTDGVRTLIIIRGMCIALLFVVALLLFILLPPRTAMLLICGIGLLISLFAWIHARKARYTCKKCSVQFKIPWWIDLFSPHWWDCKLLRCPHCGETAWHPGK
jgi:hypothetical protein